MVELEESNWTVQNRVSVESHWTRCQAQCLYDVSSINVSVKSEHAFQRYSLGDARDGDCTAKYLYVHWIQKYHLSSKSDHRNLVEKVGSISFDEGEKKKHDSMDQIVCK